MRSTVILLLLISFLGVELARSQSAELIVQGQGGKLYLPHTVVAKENWYSIGRLYNGGAKEIASFNGLTLDKPLSIGQELKIPLTAINFSQTGLKAPPAETLVPVYHIVQEKEWMYRVSVNHNKVPIPNLEKWNNINKDQVKAGMHLVVGFLKVKTAQSALAAGTTSTPAGTVTNPPAEKTPADKSAVTKLASDKAASDKAPADKSVPAKSSADKTSADKTSADKASAVKSTDKTSVEKLSADKTVAEKTPAEKTSAEKPSTDRPLPAKTIADKATDDKSLAARPAGPAPHFNGGYFATDYSESGKSFSGPAGTFKSTSGWQDGKYYALMNNVTVGTIVKITVVATNKTIYAKILGQLPDMKESVGMTVRMSNAAAGELGEGEGKFNVEVRY
ncbi:MAG TPA: LysM peptidoglycan-binding domain-containing protein [Puia sp.]|nr:LysM peptidoglycan-binding domain-containing protein [Puia sp.]